MTKKTFTRVTIDEILAEAVQKVQQIIPNYNLNDSIKLILGVGVKNLDETLIDSNGFSAKTNFKLLIAKKQLENGEVTSFDNFESAIKYIENKKVKTKILKKQTKSTKYSQV